MWRDLLRQPSTWRGMIYLTTGLALLFGVPVDQLQLVYPPDTAPVDTNTLLGVALTAAGSLGLLPDGRK